MIRQNNRSHDLFFKLLLNIIWNKFSPDFDLVEDDKNSGKVSYSFERLRLFEFFR